MKKIISKILISIVAAYAAFGSYFFDWNNTHIYNENWPPHAKFHNAQTMLLGTALGLAALWFLWRFKGNRILQLRISAFMASIYWLTQAAALIFPGTALVDPEFSYPGQPPAQLIVDIIMIIVVLSGYYFGFKGHSNRNERSLS